MRRYDSHDFTVSTKPDRTPVTEADREVEHAIREGLAAVIPPACLALLTGLDLDTTLALPRPACDTAVRLWEEVPAD